MMCEPSCEVHYGCRLRGVQVSPRVGMATATRNWKPSVTAPSAVNKRIVYEVRPGGALSPVLKADGTPLRHKEYQETQPKVVENLRRQRGGVTPILTEKVV